jgi:CSLREA domain-containing protein
VFILYIPSHASPEGSFIVNTTSDTDDGECNVAHCTLREAINGANNSAGTDTIAFTLSPSSTIILAGSQLPIIDDSLTIDGSTALNLTISGAGLSRIFSISSGTAVTLTTLTVTNGRAGSGGALINEGGILNINNSTIRNSFSDWNLGGSGSGGGISNWGTLNISNSTISGNSCSGYRGCGGGGIANGGTLNISNSTISDNSASGYPVYGGGGISNDGIVNITNSTIESNAGRGITSVGILNFINTIIANSVNSGDCASGAIGTNVNNLVEDGSCHSTLTGDPILGPLQDNGGQTWTHALKSPSPAVDKGYDYFCTIPPVNNLDQRGVTRPFDGDGDGFPRCDIGAFEYDGPPPDRSYLPVYLRN